jgi:hypothetical protein
MNLQSEHIEQLCRQLKLERVLAEYASVAQDAVREKASFTDFLERVLKVESDFRHERWPASRASRRLRRSTSPSLSARPRHSSPSSRP